jgi:hypothetical protein
LKNGIWVWPTDPAAQRKVTDEIVAAHHFVPTMTAIAKSKEGMSNAELDDFLGDYAEWMTLWVVRQLTSLGFIELKVDFFGGPARYVLTELGRNMLSSITGQPAKPPTPQAPQPSAPKAA